MPPDRLNFSARPASAVRQVTDSVLAVLSGIPIEIAAATVGMTVTDLSAAVELFQVAGYTALEAQHADLEWYQVRIQFSNWNTAEESAITILRPRLDELKDQGVITRWWFIRKHPCWRIRLARGTDFAFGKVTAILNDLVTAGAISHWWHGSYEPEIVAFGGSPGMDIAHDLFCADSGQILDYLQQPEPDIGRREISMLLCNTLLHAAGLDTFERGDVWHRIAHRRPLIATPTSKLNNLADGLRPLITAPVDPAGALFASDGPLAQARSWARSFHLTGHALAQAAAAGDLDRGIRNILTHLVIFHWNRIGLSATTQGILAHAAGEALLPRI